MGIKNAFNRWMKEYFILSLIIAALVIVSTMLIAHAFTYRPQRYSSIGLLNENREAGDFPSNMSYNETFNLYFQVENHEGESERYMVKMHVGDINTVIDPYLGVNAAANQTFQRIVNHEETWEESVSVDFDLTYSGKTVKVIFELWIYEQVEGDWQFTFTQQAVHVWIEIFS